MSHARKDSEYVAKTRGFILSKIATLPDSAFRKTDPSKPLAETLLQLSDNLTMESQDQNNEILRAAKLRGVLAKQRLLSAEGGSIGVLEVSKILGLQRQSVDKRRKAGSLIAIDIGTHGYKYPIWQFTENGVLDGIPEVIKIFQDKRIGSIELYIFFLYENLRLGNKRPLDLLKKGSKKDVIEVAKLYGEQGA